MNKINAEDVRHVAKLAELDFTEEEIKKITPQLGKIIEHVAMIGRADTENMVPKSHIADIKNVLREDKARKSLSQKSALLNAPAEEAQGFKVPKID